MVCCALEQLDVEEVLQEGVAVVGEAQVVVAVATRRPVALAEAAEATRSTHEEADWDVLGEAAEAEEMSIQTEVGEAAADR